MFQRVGFAFPVSFALGLGLVNTVLGDASSTTVTTDLSATVVGFSRWTVTAGMSLLRDAIHRSGAYIQSSLPIWTGGNLEVWGEYNLYTDGGNDIRESVLRVTLSQSW